MIPPHKKYLLYVDDTGSRDLDKDPTLERRDGMNWFGLGGILVKAEEDQALYQAYRSFCETWEIDYPLHSSTIRGRRGKFGWLGDPEKAGYFMPALRELLVSLPYLATGVIIDRPGYFQRYQSQHRDGLWHMDKTAFSILIERTAKFAEANGRKLEVVFEESGKHEDRALMGYMKSLKTDGLPFNTDRMADYQPLQAEDFRRIVLGDPHRKRKSLPQLQIADLVLFPIAKGRYQSDYRPYLELKEARKLIDDHLPEPLRAHCGIKYSCFDTPEKPKAQEKS